MPVRMEVSDLTVDNDSQSPIVILRADDGVTTLPISVGLMEASAIAAAHGAVDLPRPLTHNLFSTVISAMGGTVESAEVTAFQQDVFYAVLHIRIGDELLRIDSRPSDAIAMALQANADIFVREEVLALTAIVDTESDRWRRYIEGLDPEDFGDYRM
jgi:bifunctional DNase/RNase